MFHMPGASSQDPFVPQAGEAQLAAALRADVTKLAEEIGERSMRKPAALAESVDFIERSFRSAGLQPARQTYQIDGQDCHNIEVEIRGASRPEEIVVAGAHYDTVPACPGANDNGTGVAALLALARDLAGAKPARTLRLVAFVNEEPGYFQSEQMGSWVYANRCRARGENVVGMFSLETLGYYSDAEGSQQYPPGVAGLYPSTGNFLAFVGNIATGDLVRRAIGVFRENCDFPSEGGAFPESLPGVGWSDHWSFWRAGYPALMVTDTAPFRYPHYHLATDTPDRIDYARLARVVRGIREVVSDLAGEE